MDAEEAAAVPAAGGEAEEGDGDREGERRGGGGGGEEAWRAAAPPGSGRRRGAAAGPPRASKASPRSRGRRSRAAPVRPRRRRPGGRFPAARLTRPYGPAAAELGPGGRLPGAEGLGGGASHSQQARGCPSYRGDEHPPQPRTGLHHRRPAPDAMLRGNDASRSGRTAAERKRRRRRQRRCQPRAAVAPGCKGRRAAREERPELQLYGGPAGTRRLPRSPAGQRGAWRASCGAARRGVARGFCSSGLLGCAIRARGRPQGRADGTPAYCALASPTFWTAGRWGAKSLAVLGPQEHKEIAILDRYFRLLQGGSLTKCNKLKSSDEDSGMVFTLNLSIG